MAAPTEITLQLLAPIDFAGEVYTELKLREPKAREIDKVQQIAKSEVQVVLQLAFLMSGVPVAALGEMGARDLNRVSDFIAGFSAGGPATGATASPTSPAGSDGVPATPGT